MSPQRPRSSELEAKSRQAFRRSLPDAWAVRDQHEEDVGIDAEVEVFEPALVDGRSTNVSTALLFKVQLKATDEQNVADALALRLRVTWVEYYAQLAVPVLVAKYHAPTDALYARWFHKLAIPDHAKERETVTLRLEQDDLVTEASPQAWLEDMLVTIEPTRVEIPRGPWDSEYSIIIRNASTRTLYQVGFQIALEPHSSVQLEDLALLPQFKIDHLFNLTPAGIDATEVDTGRRVRLFSFHRLDPRARFAFTLRHQHRSHDPDPSGGRIVELSVSTISFDPAPVLHGSRPII